MIKKILLRYIIKDKSYSYYINYFIYKLITLYSFIKALYYRKLKKEKI